MSFVLRAAFAAALAVFVCVASAAAQPAQFSGSHFSGDLTTLTASTYVVNSTGNTVDFTVGNGICETATGNGVCTLRAAIQESNASVGDQDSIHFNIPDPTPVTITIGATYLPAITDPVTIDATTQPGFAGTPVVVITGPAGGGVGFTITAGNTTVRGFVVKRFLYGISIGTGGDNRIEGNYIGPDVSGTTTSGGQYVGAQIINGSTGNVIGGTSPGDGNVISGNNYNGNGYGVLITGAGVTGNSVAGNRIGTNAAGTAALANASFGVVLSGGATGNLIGGSTGTTPGGACTGACNLISANGGPGVTLGTSGNTVEGNFVGLNASGTSNLGNASGNGTGGVDVTTSSNTIGGTTPAARNVISGNGFSNVHIDNPSTPITGNVVQGNYIGTTSDGLGDASPGGNYGVVSEGGNTIGGTAGTTPGGACTGACNLIAGNGSHGIAIDRRGGLTIQGNHIGLKADGATALPNGGDGVHTFQPNSTIGGTTPGARNVISGNGNNGVALANLTTSLQGNYIGTSPDGNAAIPNGSWGVDAIATNTIGGTTGTTPGGACTGACNLITSMVVRGDNSVVQGNYIGTNAAGTAGLGGGPIQLGGTITDAVNNVLIGGDAPEERNVISGHAGVGVDLLYATSASVYGNYIGVGSDGTTSVPNGSHGVIVRGSGGANGNKIGGTNPGEDNVIAHNGGDGVFIGNLTGINNPIRRNSIHSNGGLGIDLTADGVSPNDAGDADAGGNNTQNFPVVTAASVSAGAATVAGTLNSNANQTFTIDLYSDSACDPSGNGEGRTYLGSTPVTTDGSGNASFNASSAAPPAGDSVVTATATSSGGSTSEFSLCRVIAYARPKGGGPIYASLVPAYQQCTAPNRQHAPTLSFSSCAPPSRTSGHLTVGTPDSNVRASNMVGAVKYTVIVGDPGTPADEADVQLSADVTDVRRASDLADYTGELRASVVVQITDKHNGPAATEDATMTDHEIAFTVPCAGTVDTTIGSACSTTTTADAILGSSSGVRETKRTVWGMGPVRVFDGGADNTAATTGGNTLFAVQGVFVP